MNYYSLILCLFVSVMVNQTKQFVSIDIEEITKTQESEFITVTLPFEIIDGYHIQTELENSTNFIRTELMFEDNELFEIVDYEFSKKENQIIVLDQHPHNVLSNKFVVTVVIRPNKEMSLADFKLKGQLYYQACDSRQCFFPRKLVFQLI